jgi:hypothetical protein
MLSAHRGGSQEQRRQPWPMASLWTGVSCSVGQLYVVESASLQEDITTYSSVTERRPYLTTFMNLGLAHMLAVISLLVSNHLEPRSAPCKYMEDSAHLDAASHASIPAVEVTLSTTKMFRDVATVKDLDMTSMYEITGRTCGNPDVQRYWMFSKQRRDG